MLERLAWTQGVRIDLVERRRERIGTSLGLDGRGEERKVIEPGSDAAGGVAPCFKLGEDRAGTGNDSGREPSQLRNRDSVAAVGCPVGNFVICRSSRACGGRAGRPCRP